jgi:nucleotide-binding universal stress UspA family protein
MAKTSSKKVLIALDFEEQSLIALEQGINLSKVIKAEITLLHVIEDGGILGKHLSDAQYESVRMEVDKLLEEQINELGKKHKDLKITALVARGRVYEKITEISEMLQVEFIVMGCKGGGGLKRKFIGSNALHVVRSSRCPVLTIKGKHHRAGCSNIVLPLDLTKETREKVSCAIEFARLYKSAVRVLSVIFTKDEFIVNRLTRQLGQVKTFLEKAGIECSAEIVKGIKGEDSLVKWMAICY